MNLQLCSVQCILGPSQEVRESCPEAAVWAKQTGALGSRAGGIHRGYGLFSPDQPSGDGGRGGQHECAGPPGLHAGVVGLDGHTSERSQNSIESGRAFV